MLYFDCFVVGSWMFAIGCFLGAVYVQHHQEKTERPRASRLQATPLFSHQTHHSIAYLMPPIDPIKNP